MSTVRNLVEVGRQFPVNISWGQVKFHRLPNSTLSPKSTSHPHILFLPTRTGPKTKRQHSSFLVICRPTLFQLLCLSSSLSLPSPPLILHLRKPPTKQEITPNKSHPQTEQRTTTHKKGKKNEIKQNDENWYLRSWCPIWEIN